MSDAACAGTSPRFVERTSGRTHCALPWHRRFSLPLTGALPLSLSRFSRACELDRRSEGNHLSERENPYRRISSWDRECTDISPCISSLESYSFLLSATKLHRILFSFAAGSGSDRVAGARTSVELK